MELISIIMPAYNAEEFLAESVNSVINQTYENWELLIINDGSTDKTKAIAESYSLKDTRIKVINQQNKKLGAARNTGIRAARGNWIAFLDSDDLWYPNKLEVQLKAVNKFPAADVIYTDGWIFTGNDLEKLTPYPTFTGELITSDKMYKTEYIGNYIPVLSVLVRATLVQNVGFQEERRLFYGCEDWDYWLRMAKAGAQFYGVPEKLFYYRRHQSNMSGNTTKMLTAQMAVFIKNFESVYFERSERAVPFKQIIFPLYKGLIREKNYDDINYILTEVQKVAPSNLFLCLKIGFQVLKGKSIIVIEAIERFNKIRKKFSATAT